MKFLSDYTQEGITALLSQYGGFFAFSNDQFNEKATPGVKYANCGAGLVCPADNAKLLVNGLIENGKKAVKQDLQENGKEGVIRRELANHEAYYTNCIEDTCDALEMYGITKQEIAAVFQQERANQTEWA